MKVGVIPAAGLASRMAGLPKFLLPILQGDQTLLDWHVDRQSAVVDRVVVVTRPQNAHLLEKHTFDSHVTVVAATTSTRSETVMRIIGAFPAEQYLLGMPDTYYLGHDPYPDLVSNDPQEDVIARLALWRIRDDQKGKLGQVALDASGRVMDMVDKQPTCSYDLSWGALAFRPELAGYINLEHPHIGYAVEKALRQGRHVEGICVDGKYFDCGTPAEFRSLLRTIDAASVDPRG